MLIISILAGIQATSSRGTGCKYSKTGFAIKEGFQDKRSKTDSLIDCLSVSCNCDVRCIASYNPETGLCLSVSIAAVPLDWMKDCDFLVADTGGWVTYISVHPETSLERPSAFWMMDDLCRGRNLGSKGSQLDSSVAGVPWSVVGPLHGVSSSRRFARLNASTRPEIQVRHDGNYVLDFTRPFTIALWVKSDDVISRMPLVDGWNSDAAKYAMHFWFFSSKSQDQVYIWHSLRSFSKVNNAGRLGWRHIIATSNDRTHTKFFLNGTVWPLDRNIVGSLQRVNPDKILIGRRVNDNSNIFKGGVGCVVILERAISDEEAGKLMNMCG